MITLGIIGVVAALTIPGLIAKYSKEQTVTKLKKAISVINQAYRLSYEECGDPDAETAFAMGPDEYIKTYWQPYLKILTYCTTYKTCGYDSLSPLTYANRNSCGSNIISARSRIGVFTMDGILYVIFTSQWDENSQDFAANSSYIWVDLNGPDLPNRFGHDVFALVRVQGKGVVPYGYNSSANAVNNDCSKKGTGLTCAEKIKRAGWRIEKDYPY